MISARCALPSRSSRSPANRRKSARAGNRSMIEPYTRAAVSRSRLASSASPRPISASTSPGAGAGAGGGGRGVSRAGRRRARAGENGGGGRPPLGLGIVVGVAGVIKLAIGERVVHRLLGDLAPGRQLLVVLARLVLALLV